MSHLEAIEGNPKKAIEYGERGIAIKLDPATLGTMGDAYRAIGDTAQAEQYYKTMEVAVAGQPGAYDHDVLCHRRISSAARWPLTSAPWMDPVSR